MDKRRFIRTENLISGCVNCVLSESQFLRYWVQHILIISKAENTNMQKCRQYHVREKLWLFGDLQSGNFFPTQSWSSRLFRTYIEFQTLWYLQLAPAQNSLQIYHSFTFPMHSLYTSYNQRTIASKVNLYPQWLGQIAEVIKVLLNIHKSVICGPVLE